MSFSLEIKDGDLGLSGTSLGTVIESAKLQQDLVCAILTPLGSNELHPTYGSILEDNLINPDLPGIFGTQDWKRAASLVRAELIRLCQNYQAQQIARNESDASRFGRLTLTPGEILIAVQDITFVQAEDNLLCTLTLDIGTETVELSVPISGTPAS